MLQEIIIQEQSKPYFKDPLKFYLACEELNNDADDEVSEYTRSLEAQLYIQSQKAKIEELRSEISLTISRKEKIPQVELKPLDYILMYEFIGPNSTYLVIRNANLSKIKTKKLLREHRSHSEVIGYTIDDIRGINPSICMNRILLESDY